MVETGVDTRRATEGPGGVVDTTARSPTERNAVDMPVSAAAVEAWREMRAGAGRRYQAEEARIFRRADRNAAISARVVKGPGLTRTVPAGKVPRAR